MIGYIIGTVRDKKVDRLILECNGIGYSMMTSSNTLRELSLGDEAKIHTKLIVREDDLSMIGFYDLEEEKAYELLVSVSKVGPKLALSVLSTYTPPILYSYIVSNNIVALSKVSGLGRKTAERLILELRDKVEKIGTIIDDIEMDDMGVSSNDEVIEALMALGFSRKEAHNACQDAKQLYPNGDTNEIIRRSLSMLG